jgi:SnoaL-like domain
MALPVDEQEWLDAWNSGRATPIIAIADPDVEVHAVTLGIEGRHYKGHDGLRQWMRDIRDRFGARSRADQIEAVGDDAVLIRGMVFIDDGYGSEEEQRFVMLVHLKGNKARWIGTFFSATDARSAYESGVTGPGPG